MTTRAVGPSLGSLEDWAKDVLEATDWLRKLDLGPAPSTLGRATQGRWVRAIPARPGRPPAAEAGTRRMKTPKSLVRPEARARLLHTFLHHEVQSAELFCWALLAFDDAPPAFRRGLGHLASEELGHARLYAERLAQLGSGVGQFALNDWLWDRVSAAPSAVAFAAALGVGFEGANLDHLARFSVRFRAAGDDASADILDRIAVDEIEHVKFAWHWVRQWVPVADFDAWKELLPPPLGPMLMQGHPLDRGARERASFEASFLDALVDARGPRR